MTRLLLVKSNVYELGEIIGQGAYGYEYDEHLQDESFSDDLDVFSKVEM